jgi:hypothetical protein
MYLDYVLLWPDDGCFTAETCWLEVNCKVLPYCWLLHVVFLDGNKNTTILLQHNWMAPIKNYDVKFCIGTERNKLEELVAR